MSRIVLEKGCTPDGESMRKAQITLNARDLRVGGLGTE